jgi:hypothetical protein
MAPVGHTNRLLESRFLKSPYNDKLQFRIDILLKSNNPYLIKYFTSSASSTWKRKNMKPRPRLRLLNTSRRAHVAALALGLITWAGNPAAAVLTWQNPGTGNWFDGVNWDASGNVPGVSDAALILNGGSAQAGSSINPSSLTVGTTSNTDAASGSLDVTSGDLTLGGILQVGNTTSTATSTSATGSLNAAGAISGAIGNLVVGSNQGLGSSADGTITADSYSGTHSFLGIGRDDKGGSGTGALVVTNQLALAGKVNFFEVGHIFGDGLAADGELRAASGNVLTGSSTIGTHNGSAATADNVSGVVDLGTGSLSSDQTGALTVGKLSFGRSGTVIGELNTAGLSGFGLQGVGVAEGDSSGTVTGTLVVAAGGIAGGSLAIGTTSGAADATGSASSNGGVTLSGALSVGTTTNTGTASGSLDVTSGDLTLGGLLQVGNTTSAATSTSATGSLNAAGAISGAIGNLVVGSNQGLGSSADGSITADSYGGTHSFLGIGRDDKGGSGTGSLLVTNQLALAGKVNFFEVGHIFGDGLAADGELRAASGNVLTGSSTIGTHNGSAATAGNVSGVVDLGTGSLSSDQTGALSVGKLSFGRSGTVIGELNTSGLSGFGSQSIGVADGDSSGTATGTLVVAAGGIAGGSLAIGTTSGAANATGSASSNGGVTLTAGLMVGNNSGGAGSTADGALSVTNADLLIGGPITLGQVSGSDAGKQAIATLDLVTGELAARRVGIAQATGAGSTDARMTLQGVTGRIQSLQVGESFDAQGNPNGRVELLGSVLNAEEFVALGSGLSGGSGNGAISLKDSRLNVGVGPESGSFYGDMFVGTSGAGSQAGLMLERSLVDVADRLLLGAASQLQIGIEGGVRIAQYGAIDTRTAVLGGDLDLRFDFTPLLTAWSLTWCFLICSTG